MWFLVFSIAIGVFCMMIISYLEDKYDPNRPRMISFPSKMWIFGYFVGIVMQTISVLPILVAGLETLSKTTP